ncbi:unnamed protein product [Owenia fusiformis]|uniref:Uncharacterized protein n=1 Tax=Owenia fusiformis TaxID=6347 RepID=A0A8J1TBZ7_OWEFU|nr:unnamed protein product [Owenia fusiformis]
MYNALENSMDTISEDRQCYSGWKFRILAFGLCSIVCSWIAMVAKSTGEETDARETPFQTCSEPDSDRKLTDFTRIQMEAIVKRFKLKDPTDIELLPAYLEKWAEWEEAILETNISILDLSPIPFLSDYRSPCWISRLSSHPPEYVWSRGRENDIVMRYWQESHDDGVRFRLRCLPYFYIVGVVKSGTTDLFHRICSHPDVAEVLRKEYHWWSYLRPPDGELVREKHGGDSGLPVPMSVYVNAFDVPAEDIRNSSALHLIIGDGSPSTATHITTESSSPMGPELINADFIYHVTPQARIIYIVRDPVERLYSAYLFFHQYEYKSPELFHKRVKARVDAFTKCTSTYGSIRPCVYHRFGQQDGVEDNIARMSVTDGMYSVLIEDWVKVFSHEAILVLRMEDMPPTMEDTMKRVLIHLGIRRFDKVSLRGSMTEDIDKMRRVRHRKVPDMWNSTRKMLQDFYRPFNKHLSDLTHNSKYNWGY